MTTTRRSKRVSTGRQVGLCVTWTEDERAWLEKRAKGKGVSMARLIRGSVAKVALNEGDTPPDTLCTADDYSEGTCAR